jgi:hypothetical protein
VELHLQKVGISEFWVGAKIINWERGGEMAGCPVLVCMSAHFWVLDRSTDDIGGAMLACYNGKIYIQN